MSFKRSSEDDTARWGDRTVAKTPRGHAWTRNLFRQEVLSPEEAFAEGERERLERMERDAETFHRLPLVGGPLDGSTFMVPDPIYKANVPFSVPLPVKAPSGLVDPSGEPMRPSERAERAVYRLIRENRLMRYVKTQQGAL